VVAGGEYSKERESEKERPREALVELVLLTALVLPSLLLLLATFCCHLAAKATKTSPPSPIHVRGIANSPTYTQTTVSRRSSVCVCVCMLTYCKHFFIFLNGKTNAKNR